MTVVVCGWCGCELTRGQNCACRDHEPIHSRSLHRVERVLSTARALARLRGVSIDAAVHASIGALVESEPS